MPLLHNLARMTVASSGTGTITLNAAVAGFATFDLAGCSTASSGSVVWYAINDTNQSEIGYGTYTSSSLTLTRSPVRTSAGSTSVTINMSNAAQVFITPAAEGLLTQVVKQVFTSSGTYVPTAGMISCVIECVGGGAGGGGVLPIVGGVSASAGGGGSGGYSRTYAQSSAFTSSGVVVSVGAGGAGGAAGFNVGSSGGTTSVGTLCIAFGGSGGLPGGSIFNPGSGGAGGLSGTGDIAGTGMHGGTGVGNQITTVSVAGGFGGSTPYGGGGVPPIITGGTADALNGIAPSSGGFGGGGSGACFNNIGASNRAGGNGAAGIAIITEFVN